VTLPVGTSFILLLSLSFSLFSCIPGTVVHVSTWEHCPSPYPPPFVQPVPPSLLLFSSSCVVCAVPFDLEHFGSGWEEEAAGRAGGVETLPQPPLLPASTVGLHGLVCLLCGSRVPCLLSPACLLCTCTSPFCGLSGRTSLTLPALPSLCLCLLPLLFYTLPPACAWRHIPLARSFAAGRSLHLPLLGFGAWNLPGGCGGLTCYSTCCLVGGVARYYGGSPPHPLLHSPAGLSKPCYH